MLLKPNSRRRTHERTSARINNGRIFTLSPTTNRLDNNTDSIGAVMTIVSLFGARRMGKSVIQRMYMEYIKEKNMNERIRQLLNEATSCIKPDLSIKRTVTLNEMQKFADLIVQDCAKICNDVGVAVFAEQVQNNFGTAQTCKVAIEKHFGVEA